MDGIDRGPHLVPHDHWLSDIDDFVKDNKLDERVARIMQNMHPLDVRWMHDDENVSLLFKAV